LTMEWIIEGIFLIFIGLLCACITFIDYSHVISTSIYVLSAVFLIILAIISLLTAFKINFLPYKLCPLIFCVSAALILYGTLY
jgi:hypothetical protein